MVYTYSWRDGGYEQGLLNPEDVMEALAADLMSDSDLPTALRRISRCGVRAHGEDLTSGTQALLDQVRARRREELEKYDLASMVQDIAERISDIVETERAGIARRREGIETAMPSGTSDDRRALESVLDRRQEMLTHWPDGPGASVTRLAEYEFVTDFARLKFEALMDVLQRRVLQAQFRVMQASVQGLTTDDIADLTAALHDLNDLIERREELVPSDFDSFRAARGSHFPPADNLDDLLGELQAQAGQTESLLSSLAPELRRSLEDSMASALTDPDLREEMDRLQMLMESIEAASPPAAQYPFSGDQSLTLEEALNLMRHMSELDQLESALRDVHESAEVSAIESDRVSTLLGERAGASWRSLQALVPVLEDAGYVYRDGNDLQLTARGIRRIGQKALQDIFHGVKRSALGDHPIPHVGPGSDGSEDSKSYEFGDPFLLHLSGTLMNAVARGGAGSRIQLAVSDFEVYCTERVSQAATVLLVDLSRSMPMRGCFVAAKKVALALNTLIQSEFPRDRLYVVGFADYARELRADALFGLTMDEQVQGTNIQDGLFLARRLLSTHGRGTRQIILITDGEPTAHWEDNKFHFSYPPSPRTVEATLREVRRCTRAEIVINTFMLGRSPHLVDFVYQMTRMNNGRVFFATPERLGDYVLLDYVRGRRATM